MKFVRYFLVLLFLHGLFSGFGQTFAEKKLTALYEKYFDLPRERVHLHLNKTSFLPGEKIWFKAYIQESKSGLPSLKTSNLYCFLYDEQGNLLEQKNFLAEGGTAIGQFTVKRQYTTKALYLKAFTNWMRNFDAESGFVQRMSILGNQNTASTDTTKKKDLIIDFLPEGGHLISEINNSIGFVIRGGSGEKLEIEEGRILNEMGEVLLRGINVNHRGAGKFNLNMQPLVRYFAEFQFTNGQTLRQALPSSESEGIGISINSFTDDQVTVALHTNKGTLQNIQNKTFQLAVHRDGKIGLHPIVFNAERISIRIDKNELLPGINVLTLFDFNHKPVVERLFFNDYGFSETLKHAELLNTSKENDSLKLILRLKQLTDDLTSLSASVLPADTESNTANKSIVSSFLISPYMKEKASRAEAILNPDRKKLYEMDVLLLTEGWSRYNWMDIFHGGGPEIMHARFEGVAAEGRVINAEFNKPNQLALFPNSSQGMLNAPIDKGKKFSLEDIYLIKGDSVDITLLDTKGRPEKPKLEISFAEFFEGENLQLSLELLKDESSFVTKEPEKPLSFEALQDDGTFALDNVTLYGKGKENELTQNKGLTFGIFEGVKITEDDVRKKVKLSRLILSFGFRINTDPFTNALFVGPKIPFNQPPIIILNGFQLRPGDLLDFPLETVDEVYYEHQGTHGSNGGTIYIYRRNGNLVGQKPDENFVRVLATEGFDRPETYYNPRYSSFTNNDFIAYGTIHWQPEIAVGRDGLFEIKFPDYGVEEVLVHLEGMGSEGSLVSDQILVRLEKDD